MSRLGTLACAAPHLLENGQGCMKHVSVLIRAIRDLSPFLSAVLTGEVERGLDAKAYRAERWRTAMGAIEQVKFLALDDEHSLKRKWERGPYAMAHMIEPKDEAERTQLIKDVEEGFNDLRLYSTTFAFTIRHLSAEGLDDGILDSKLLYVAADITKSSLALYEIGLGEEGIGPLLQEVFAAEDRETMTRLLELAAAKLTWLVVSEERQRRRRRRRQTTSSNEETTTVTAEETAMDGVGPLLSFRNNMVDLVELPSEAEEILAEQLEQLALPSEAASEPGLIHGYIKLLADNEYWDKLRLFKKEIPDEDVKEFVLEVASIVMVVANNSLCITNMKRAVKAAKDTALALASAFSAVKGPFADTDSYCACFGKIGNLSSDDGELRRFAETISCFADSVDTLAVRIENEQPNLPLGRRLWLKVFRKDGDIDVEVEVVLAEKRRAVPADVLKRIASYSAANAFVLQNVHLHAEKAFRELVGGMSDMNAAIDCWKSIVVEGVVTTKNGDHAAALIVSNAASAIEAFKKGLVSEKYETALLDALVCAFEKVQCVVKHFPAVLRELVAAGDDFEVELERAATDQGNDEYGEIAVLLEVRKGARRALSAVKEVLAKSEWMESDDVVERAGVRSRGAALYHLAATGRKDFVDDAGVQLIALYAGSLVAGLVMLPASLSLVVAALEVVSASSSRRGLLEVAAAQFYMSSEAGGGGGGGGGVEDENPIKPMSTVLPLALPFGFIFGVAGALGVGVGNVILRVLKKPRRHHIALQLVAVVCIAAFGYVFGAWATSCPPHVEMAATVGAAGTGAAMLLVGALGLRTKLIAHIENVLEIIKAPS